MRMVGFSEADVKNITMYQRVRRKSERLEVVDKSRNGAVPRDIGVSHESSEVGSTLTKEPSSGERNSEETTSAGGRATSRRLHDSPDTNQQTDLSSDTPLGDEFTTVTASTAATKKTRRSSKDVHKSQAKLVAKKKTNTKAMKVVTVLIKQNNELRKGDPKKKSINGICKEVNAKHNTTIMPWTANRYVKKGLVNCSPLKRGPAGHFDKPTHNALRLCYASFLQ